MKISKNNNIWLVNFKKLQGIPLFQAVSASKANTFIPNLATDDKIFSNKQIYLFLCINLIWKRPTLIFQTFPMIKISPYNRFPLLLCISLIWSYVLKFLCIFEWLLTQSSSDFFTLFGVVDFFFLYKKRQIENKQLLMWTHALYYPQSDITN